MTEEDEASRQTPSAHFPPRCPHVQLQRGNPNREGGASEEIAHRWVRSLTRATRLCLTVTIRRNVPAEKLWEEPKQSVKRHKSTFGCLLPVRKRMCGSLSSKSENLFSHRDRGVTTHCSSLTQRLKRHAGPFGVQPEPAGRHQRLKA